MLMSTIFMLLKCHLVVDTSGDEVFYLGTGHYGVLSPGLRVEMRRELKSGGVCKRISMRIDSKYLLDVSIGTCLG
jgi:hypothetical protein